MNHGQDTVHGEVIRELCDTFESLLGTYHSHTTATGGRYDSPEQLLEDLIEHLRVMVPEPEDEETDQERIKRWKKLDKESTLFTGTIREREEGEILLGKNIAAALEDEGDSI